MGKETTTSFIADLPRYFLSVVGKPEPFKLLFRYRLPDMAFVLDCMAVCKSKQEKKETFSQEQFEAV